MERGAGLPAVDRLAYLAEQAEAQLAGVGHLILAGARSPVSFFAYPGQRSDLVPDGARWPFWPIKNKTWRRRWTYSPTWSRPGHSRSWPPPAVARPSRAR